MFSDIGFLDLLYFLAVLGAVFIWLIIVGYKKGFNKGSIGNKDRTLWKVIFILSIATLVPLFGASLIAIALGGTFGF